MMKYDGRRNHSVLTHFLFILVLILSHKSRSLATDLTTKNPDDVLSQSDHHSVPFDFDEFRGDGDLFYPYSEHPGQESGNDHVYQFFFPQRRPSLQAIVDDITIQLMGTTLGHRIALRILQCDPELIENHLSVSAQAANEIARKCLIPPKTPFPFDSYVHSSPRDVLKKWSLRPLAEQKRLYFFVVTKNNDDFSFTSWTDSFSNKSVFILRNFPSSPELTYGYLTQLIAHEIGIYFDSQFIPGTEEWQEIPTNEEFKNSFGDNWDSMSTILTNPLIANVFAYMRAFKVEQIMVEELIQQNKLRLNPELTYGKDKYPFLFDDWTTEESANYLAQQVHNLLPMALPLVAWAPNYRRRKILEIKKSSSVSPSAQITDEEMVLDKYAQNYLVNSIKVSIFIRLLDLRTIAYAENSDWDKARDIFENQILPNELSALRKNQSTGGNSPLNLYEYMSTPLLSGYNIAGSRGPRPRIRAGGYHVDQSTSENSVP